MVKTGKAGYKINENKGQNHKRAKGNRIKTNKFLEAHETVNEKVAISGDWLRGNAARVFSTSHRIKYSTWTMQLGVIFFFNARVRISLMQLIRNTTIALTEFAIKFLPSVAQVLETV